MKDERSSRESRNERERERARMVRMRVEMIEKEERRTSCRWSAGHWCEIIAREFVRRRKKRKKVFMNVSMMIIRELKSAYYYSFS